MGLIETITHNFPTIATIGGSVLGGGLFGHWFKHKKDITDALMIRVNYLEELSKQERDTCSAKIDALSIRLRTTNANLAAIMLSLEMAPEKAAEIVRRMRVVMEEMEKEGVVHVTD